MMSQGQSLSAWGVLGSKWKRSQAPVGYNNLMSPRFVNSGTELPWRHLSSPDRILKFTDGITPSGPFASTHHD